MFARVFFSFFSLVFKTLNVFTSNPIQGSNQGTTVIRKPGFCLRSLSNLGCIDCFMLLWSDKENWKLPGGSGRIFDCSPGWSE